MKIILNTVGPHNSTHNSRQNLSVRKATAFNPHNLQNSKKKSVTSSTKQQFTQSKSLMKGRG